MVEVIGWKDAQHGTEQFTLRERIIRRAKADDERREIRPALESGVVRQ